MFDTLKRKLTYYSGELWLFLKSFIFWKNFSGIMAMFAGVMLFIFWWLRCYTNHGESLEVHKYIGMKVDDAIEKANDRSFDVVINDSIYKIGILPGTVIDQNPKPFSRVKENRTIYLTIAKSTPDMVRLPDFYGNDDYTQYTKTLQVYNIGSRIADRQFNPKLEENTILEVRYRGTDITHKIREGFKVPKGDTLDFVISQRSSTDIAVPDLVCMTYDAASFFLSSYNLNIGTVTKDNTVTDESTAYVWQQEPAFDPSVTLRVGEQINLYLTQEKPAGCPEEEAPTDNNQ